MMYRNPDERRGPITPQLALRVAIIGGVCLVMFGVVFFRLWYLQVLSGDKYLAEANNNQVRDITVLLNVAVALPFFALVRRILRPILVVDPAARMRRRADPIESGPLGLRGLEVRR